MMSHTNKIDTVFAFEVHGKLNVRKDFSHFTSVYIL